MKGEGGCDAKTDWNIELCKQNNKICNQIKPMAKTNKLIFCET